MTQQIIHPCRYHEKEKERQDRSRKQDQKQDDHQVQKKKKLKSYEGTRKIHQTVSSSTKIIPTLSS